MGDQHQIPNSDKKKSIITIAGRPGSGKSTTAKLVASRLGFQHFSSGELFRRLAEEQGTNVLQANLSAEQNAKIDFLVDGRLRDIGASSDKQVIDSRMAWHWIPFSFKVFLDLDLTVAAQRIIDRTDAARLVSEHIPHDPNEYALVLRQRLESEARRYKALYNVNPFDVSNYDLVADTAANNVEQAVDLVLRGFQDWLKK